MLSLLDEEQLRKLYPRQELPRLTTNSITSRSDLETELDETRHRGHATSRQGSEDGVTSVAVALAGPSGAVYGVNVSVPAHRMSEELRGDLGVILRAAAAGLQGRLV
jgi:DNA-binding IclR family transcriptional regulator